MVYLDNNATTQIAPSVLKAMEPFLSGEFGNPSSAHSLAAKGRTAIDDARGKVARLVGAAKDTEIVFTSGGTESDNWAILGTLETRPECTKIITTKVEHEAVRKVAEKLELRGYEVVWLDVGSDGTLDTDSLAENLDMKTALVSIMLANNETGVVFPVEELAHLVKSRSSAAFHVDAVNAAGKIDIDVSSTEIDLLSISAHKFQGPKGVGALYVRSGFEIAPNSIGGGQETGRRAGTEAVHQIVGLGEAARIAADLRPMESIESLRDTFEDTVLADFENSSVNGNRTMRIPNTSNISFEGLNGELILAGLDSHEIYVSTGSACNEANHVSSPVLRAMDIPYTRAMGAIRFSFGRNNSAKELDFVISRLHEVVAKARAIAGC